MASIERAGSFVLHFDRVGGIDQKLQTDSNMNSNSRPVTWQDSDHNTEYYGWGSNFYPSQTKETEQWLTVTAPSWITASEACQLVALGNSGLLFVLPWQNLISNL